MEATYRRPPWLTGSYHPRFGYDRTPADVAPAAPASMAPGEGKGKGSPDKARGKGGRSQTQTQQSQPYGGYPSNFMYQPGGGGGGAPGGGGPPGGGNSMGGMGGMGMGMSGHTPQAGGLGRRCHSGRDITAMPAGLLCESLRSAGECQSMAVWSDSAAPGKHRRGCLAASPGMGRRRAAAR